MITTFGPFTLDDGARQLCRDGHSIHLSPKAFDLLTLLVKRCPAAVSKSDILETLWRDTFVSEGNLAVLVKEIRDALDDDAQRPTFIRTVQRFGYAFSKNPPHPPRQKSRSNRHRAIGPPPRKEEWMSG